MPLLLPTFAPEADSQAEEKFDLRLWYLPELIVLVKRKWDHFEDAFMSLKYKQLQFLSLIWHLLLQNVTILSLSDFCFQNKLLRQRL